MKRREVKSKGEKERYKHLNAEFQRIARRDKKAFLGDQCKEIEENSRMGKTRDLFKKIRDTKGTFHAKMGSIKDTRLGPALPLPRMVPATLPPTPTEGCLNNLCGFTSLCPVIPTSSPQIPFSTSFPGELLFNLQNSVKMILQEESLFYAVGGGQGSLLPLLHLIHFSSSCLVIFSSTFTEHLVYTRGCGC